MTDTNRSKLDAAVKLAQQVAKAHDAELREKTFEIVLKFLLSGEQANQPEAIQSPKPRQNPRGRASEGMQLNEFLAQFGAKSHTDRVTAIAYYVFKERNEPITIAEIVDVYSRARLKKPRNVSDVLGSCVRRGFFVDSDRKDGAKAWVITGIGEEFIEEYMKA